MENAGGFAAKGPQRALVLGEIRPAFPAAVMLGPDDSDEFPVNASCDPVWLCPTAFYDDGDCDCGCGIQDVDCNGTTNENECELCSFCQGNVNACGDGEVDPANTTQCL